MIAEATPSLSLDLDCSCSSWILDFFFMTLFEDSTDLYGNVPKEKYGPAALLHCKEIKFCDSDLHVCSRMETMRLEPMATVTMPFLRLRYLVCTLLFASSQVNAATIPSDIHLQNPGGEWHPFVLDSSLVGNPHLTCTLLRLSAALDQLHNQLIPLLLLIFYAITFSRSRFLNWIV